MKTGPHGDAKVGVQDRPHVSRIHSPHIEGEETHMVSEIFSAIDFNPVHGIQAVTESGEQFHLLLVNGFDTLFLKKVESFGKANDAHQVERPGLQAMGIGLGVDQGSSNQRRSHQNGWSALPAPGE